MRSDRQGLDILTEIMQADDWSDLGRRLREAAVEIAAECASNSAPLPMYDPTQPIETAFPECWRRG
jgi:hypothetical protein